MRRNSGLILVGGLLWGGAVVFAVSALDCGGPEQLGGGGTDCYRAEDCQPGLVCIAGSCTGDLSSIERQEDAPSDGAKAGEGSAEGAPQDDVATPPDGNATAGDGAAGTGGTGGSAGAGGSAGTGGSAAGTGGASGVGGAGGTGGTGGMGGTGGSGTMDGSSGTGGTGGAGGTGGTGPGDAATGSDGAGE